MKLLVIGRLVVAIVAELLAPLDVDGATVVSSSVIVESTLKLVVGDVVVVVVADRCRLEFNRLLVVAEFIMTVLV